MGGGRGRHMAAGGCGMGEGGRSTTSTSSASMAAKRMSMAAISPPRLLRRPTPLQRHLEAALDSGAPGAGPLELERLTHAVRGLRMSVYAQGRVPLQLSRRAPSVILGQQHGLRRSGATGGGAKHRAGCGRRLAPPQWLWGERGSRSDAQGRRRRPRAHAESVGGRGAGRRRGGVEWTSGGIGGRTWLRSPGGPLRSLPRFVRVGKWLLHQKGGWRPKAPPLLLRSCRGAPRWPRSAQRKRRSRGRSEAAVCR